MGNSFGINDLADSELLDFFSILFSFCEALRVARLFLCFIPIRIV